jgi:hypothetical protein
MGKHKVCPECGVPKVVAKQQKWESDGTITQVQNPGYRLFLADIDGLDFLFSGLQEMLGIPIDSIITEGTRKASLLYLRHVLAGLKGKIVRAVAIRQAYQMLSKVGVIMGYGYFELIERKKGEHVKIFGRDPYFLPLVVGDLLATFNVLEGTSAEVDLKEEDGGWMITMAPGEENIDLVSRLEQIVVPAKPGTVRFARCRSCGTPVDLRSFHWDYERGSLVDNSRQRRVAVIDPEGIESVMRELEAELGEDIPRAVLDTYRRYAKEAIRGSGAHADPDRLAHWLAVVGMGNLVEHKVTDGAMEAVVENASPTLLVAGMLQGSFELATGTDSTCEYARGGDGTLAVKLAQARGSGLES